MIVIFRLATIGRLNVYTDNRWQPYPCAQLALSWLHALCS